MSKLNPDPSIQMDAAEAEAEARKQVRAVQVVFPPVKIFQPDGSVLIKPGKAVVLSGDDEINTAEAAKILGCASDWVGRLCDQGRFKEGTDWRRNGPTGNYKLKRSSVLKYRDSQATV